MTNAHDEYAIFFNLVDDDVRLKGMNTNRRIVFAVFGGDPRIPYQGIEGLLKASFIFGDLMRPELIKALYGNLEQVELCGCA